MTEDNVQGQPEDALGSEQQKADRPKTKVPVNKLKYSGKMGKVFSIWLKNLLLNIITLGIYSFWGKAHLRRYTIGSMKLDGDRFEYNGTGFEMLIGFLKAVGILIGLGIVVAISEIFLGIIGAVISTVFFVAVFLGFYPFIVYLSTRYRLNRTKWRGIRGHLGGKAQEYVAKSVFYTWINSIVLGYFIPDAQIAKFTYKANNTSFGTLKMRYKGDAKRLRSVHIKTAIAGVISALVVAVVPFYLLIFSGMAFMFFPHDAFEGAAAGNVDLMSPQMLFVMFFTYIGILLAPIVFLLVRSPYKSALLAEKMRGLRLGSFRFKSRATWWDYAKFSVGNMLIITFTLGLGRAFVMQRTMKFFTTNIIIGGDLNTDEVLQAKEDQDLVGEGLEDIMGFDVGIL